MNADVTTSSIVSVVFDLDDVMYSHRDYVRSGMRAVARYIHAVYGFHVEDALLEHAVSDCDFNTCVKNALSPLMEDINASFLCRLELVYSTHTPAISLDPRAVSCLAILRARSIRTGLLADGNPAIQRHKARTLNLHQLMDSVIFAGDLLGPDQVKSGLWLLMQDMDCSPEQMLFVGRPASIELCEAGKAGVHTLALCRHTPPAETESARSIQRIDLLWDWIARNFTTLPEFRPEQQEWTG